MKQREWGLAAVPLELVGAVVLLQLGVKETGFSPGPRNGNERSPSTSLKTLPSAQADFRANGRDGDGVNQL